MVLAGAETEAVAMAVGAMEEEAMVAAMEAEASEVVLLWRW